MDRMLPLRKLCRLLAVRRETLLAWIEAGDFPEPVLLPNQCRRWRESAVTAWLATLTGGELVAESIDLAVLPPMAQEILQVLAESAEEWLKGSEIAAKISGDVDSTGGTFGRAVRALKRHKPPLIESDRRGYRLTPTGRAHAANLIGGSPVG